MQFSRTLIGKGILALVAIVGVTTALTAQTGQQLYLVTGSQTRFDELKVPSAVFRVDQPRHTLLRVTDLVDATQGSNFILAGHDRRVLVIGSPHLLPTRVVMLSMDSPATPRTIPIAVENGAPQAYILDQPGGGAVLSLLTYNDKKWSLTGVDLQAKDPVQRDLAWADYRLVRLEGAWAPGDNPGGHFTLLPKDGKVASNRGGAVVDLDITFPKSFESEADQTFRLIVSNDEILVIDRSKEREKGLAGPPGSTRLSIYDKKTKTWQTETFAGGGSNVRGFGVWIAVNEAEIRVDLSNPERVEHDPNALGSPGQLQRQRPINPEAPVREQVTIESAFALSPLRFTGSISLYNVRSQTRYRIDVGQGDTEVLLVDGTTVYYRVNDILYRAQLGKTAVERPMEILRDDSVQRAHWAFVGP